MVKLFHIENSMQDIITKELRVINEQMGKPIARSEVMLTVNDPVAKDDSGNPIRMIRRTGKPAATDTAR